MQIALEKNAVDKAVNFIAKSLNKADNMEEFVSTFEAKEMPDELLEAGTVLLAVTAARQTAAINLPAGLFENIGPYQSVENLQKLSSNAIRKLSESCKSMGTSVVDVIEETRDNIGPDELSKEFAVMCSQAAVLAKEWYIIAIRRWNEYSPILSKTLIRLSWVDIHKIYISSNLKSLSHLKNLVEMIISGQRAKL